jgi:hypothetical protein
VNIRLALACTALGALAAGGAVAQDHNTAAYQQCDRANPSRTPQACNRAARAYYQTHPYAPGYYQGYQYPAYYPPPAEAYGAPAAYQGPPPGAHGPAPVIVRGGRYYYGAIPGDTSPGADFSIRLPSLVNIHSSVTAAPNPNNVSDQVPSRGFPFDGVPPDYPY